MNNVGGISCFCLSTTTGILKYVRHQLNDIYESLNRWSWHMWHSAWCSERHCACFNNLRTEWCFAPFIETILLTRSLSHLWLPGLPPDSLTVDQDRLYWSNDAQQVMLSIDKRTGLDLVTDRSTSQHKNILAFGDNLQPLPGTWSTLIFYLSFLHLIRKPLLRVHVWVLWIHMLVWFTFYLFSPAYYRVTMAFSVH